MTIRIDKIYFITEDTSHQNVNCILNNINDIGIPDPKAIIDIITTSQIDISDEKLNEMGVSLREDGNISEKNIKLALSHIKIWKDAYEMGYENILIYEDGIIKCRDMNWSDIDNTDFDLLYLGRCLDIDMPDVWDRYFNEDLCIPGMSTNLYAYILSKSGIKKIIEDFLSNYEKILFPVDIFIASLYDYVYYDDIDNIFNSKSLNALALNRQIVTQDKAKS